MQTMDMAGELDSEYVVADIKLEEFGRKEIEIAEHEMPGLMAIGEILKRKTTRWVRITGSLHMTIQTAVLDRDID